MAGPIGQQVSRQSPALGSPPWTRRMTLLHWFSTVVWLQLGLPRLPALTPRNRRVGRSLRTYLLTVLSSLAAAKLLTFWPHKA